MQRISALLGHHRQTTAPTGPPRPRGTSAPGSTCRRISTAGRFREPCRARRRARPRRFLPRHGRRPRGGGRDADPGDRARPAPAPGDPARRGRRRADAVSGARDDQRPRLRQLGGSAPGSGPAPRGRARGRVTGPVGRFREPAPGPFATPLLVRFIGTMTEPDSSRPCIMGFGLPLPHAAPVCPRQPGGLPGPDSGRTYAHGFLDTVEPRRHSPLSQHRVLPWTIATASALQTMRLSAFQPVQRSRPTGMNAPTCQPISASLVGPSAAT